VRRQDTRVNRLSTQLGGPRIVAMHIAFLALVPVAVFANKAAVLAFLLAALPNLRLGGWQRLWSSAALLATGIFLLCAWALISLSYAPEPDLGRAVRHLLLLPVGLVWVAGLTELEPRQQRDLSRTLLLAAGLTVLVFLFEIVIGGLITRLAHPDGFSQEKKLYERIAVGLVLLVGVTWPVCQRLWVRSRGLAVLFLAAVVACVLVLPMAAAVLALLVGGTSLLLALRWPRMVLAVALVFLLGYLAAAPTLSRHWLTIADARESGLALPSGWEHRLGIWNYVAVEVGAVGLLGAGYDSSRVVGRRDDVIVEITGPDGSHPEALPLHPHNAVLQVWLELGLPGVAALGLIILGLFALLLRAPPPAARRAALIATAATLAVPLLISFGVWQSWWLSALMLCAGAAVILLGPSPGAPRPG